jgi:outer membrane protein assembly factor BamE (lipoprotein component of BamABCDE complex)
MRKYFFCKAIIIYVAILLTGCSQNNIQLENFEEEDWKNDKWGCKGKRLSMVDNLRENKEKLKGLNQFEVVKLLGQPDQKELYGRNQIFYTYFIDQSSKCQETEKRPKTFIIRFNSINQANEFILEN